MKRFSSKKHLKNWLLAAVAFSATVILSPLSEAQVSQSNRISGNGAHIPGRHINPGRYDNLLKQQKKNNPLPGVRLRALLLTNGSLFTGNITAESNQFRVQLSEKSSFSFPVSQVAIVASSVDELYEIRSRQLKPADINGRKKLVRWCLREKLFLQAEKEIAKMSQLTYVRRSDLLSLNRELVAVKEHHQKQLQIAKQRQNQKRQARKKQGTVRQMSFSTEAKGSSRQQPTIKSVFNVYPDPASKRTGTKNNPQNKNAKSSENTNSKSQGFAPKPLQTPPGTENQSNANPQNATDPLKKKSESTKTKNSTEKEPELTSAFQTRPTPDPKRPYDPDVFNRFYHPEKFAKTAGKSSPALKNSKPSTTNPTTPSLFRSRSIFQSREKKK